MPVYLDIALTGLACFLLAATGLIVWYLIVDPIGPDTEWSELGDEWGDPDSDYDETGNPVGRRSV